MIFCLGIFLLIVGTSSLGIAEQHKISEDMKHICIVFGICNLFLFLLCVCIFLSKLLGN